MSKVFQILNWQRSFENERSRAVDRCSYVCLPNKIGMGLARLLSLDEGSALFGCFVLITEACSRQRKPRNGYLTDDGRPDGRAWDAEDIAVMIRRPAREVARTLEVLSQPKIGWIVEVDVDEAIAAGKTGDDRAEAHAPTTPESESKSGRQRSPTADPRPTPVDPPSDPPHKGGRKEGKEEPPGGHVGDVVGGAEEVRLEVIRPSDDPPTRLKPTTRHPAFAELAREFAIEHTLGPKNRDRLDAMLGAFGVDIVRAGLTEARANGATNPLPYADSVCNRLYAEKFQGRRSRTTGSYVAPRKSPNQKVVYE